MILWRRKEEAAKIQESFMSKLSGRGLDKSANQGQLRMRRSGQSWRANNKLRKQTETSENKQTKSKLKV